MKRSALKGKGKKGGMTTENVVDGVATFGRVTTVISSIIATLVAIMLFVFGVLILRAPTDPSRPVGTVVTKTTNAAGKTTTSTANGQPAPKWLGWLLIFLSIVILIATWVWFYFVWTNKNVAAVAGVANGVGMMNQGFSSSPPVQQQEYQQVDNNNMY